MLTTADLVNDFVNQLETHLRKRITDSVLNSLNGTHGKPKNGYVPQVEKKPRKKMVISKARRAQMRLTGQYMGLLRGLNKKDQTSVKSENKKSGMVAALALAGRLKAQGEKSVKTNGKKPAAKTK